MARLLDGRYHFGSDQRAVSREWDFKLVSWWIFAKRNYPEAKHELALLFVERCAE
jgi:hypothetical protein